MTKENNYVSVFNRLARANIGRIIDSKTDGSPLALVMGINGNTQLAIVRPDGSGSIFEVVTRLKDLNNPNQYSAIEKFLAAHFYEVNDENPKDDDRLLGSSSSYTPATDTLRVVASTALNPQEFADKIENAISRKIEEQQIARLRVRQALKKLHQLNIESSEG